MAEDGEKKESESKKHTYPLVRVCTNDHRRVVAQPCVNGDRLSQWRIVMIRYQDFNFDTISIRYL